ncbi:hypothetical protein BJV82DRAFT_662368 [Fennellomyces sp. T-0311]|nr:hypothetical protein BJV82DRAFT_662368 [Fennellomyces sp. T-0311]
MRPSTAVGIIKNAGTEALLVAQPFLAVASTKMRRNPRLTVLAFCVLTMAYQIRKAVLVPRKLRHLPRVNSVDLLWSHLKGDSVDVRSEQLLMGLMKEHGLCLKYMMGRWTLTVGDPLLLQTLLRDPKTFPKEVNASLDPDLILTNAEPNMGNSGYVDWRRQRRVANPVFHRSMPIQVFGNIVTTMFTSIDAEKTADVDFADYMRR